MNNVAMVFFVAAWKIAPMMKVEPAMIMDLFPYQMGVSSLQPHI